MNRLEATNLNFNYKNRTILESINFKIKKGSFVTFTGTSGCGKTTLLNIIGKLAEPTSGKIINTYDGYSIVFQKDTLLEWCDVLKNVMLPLEIKNNNQKENIEKCNKFIDLVGLKGFESFYPSQLSGGMRKRVEIARALVENNELLILDEPFSSLDMITREKLNVLLKEISIKTDKTVILVTHSIEEACYLSDEIYILGDRPSTVISQKKIDKSEHKNNEYILSKAEMDAGIDIRKITSDKWKDTSLNTDFISDTTVTNDKWDGLLPGILLQAAVIFLLLGVIKLIFKIPDFYYPYPHMILLRFIETISNGYIIKHLLSTIYESLSGFFIAFLITSFIGYMIAANKTLRKIFMPILISANTIPSIAIAPILVSWFGFGYIPKIIISIIIIFFPMLINTTTAFTYSKNRFKDIVRVLNPGFIFRLIKFEIPGALPQILTGVKVSSTLSVIGAVVGEFIAGSTGLGFLVNYAKNSSDYEMMYVPIIWLIIMGLSYYFIASIFYDIATKHERLK